MQLIAIKDFYRVGALEGVEIEGAVHEKVIHKGAVFSIGQAKSLKDEKNIPDKQLIAQLVYSGCVADASDPKVVEAVKAEIAIDKKREANARKLNEDAEGKVLVKQLTDLVTKAAK